MIRKMTTALAMVLLTATLVWAEWQVDFRDIYLDEGIDAAVIEALKQGATPEGIMENGLALEGLNPQNLIKAMYCGGIRGDDIKAAADLFEVTEMLVVAGYEKSVEECGDLVVDTQAYTPVAVPGVSFVGPPVPGGGSSASPFTF